MRVWWLALCGLFLVCVGCGGGGGGPLGDGGGDASATAIQGRVVDSASSQPIPDATVTVGGRSTRTASDGTFRLSTDPGTISISVAAATYHTGTFPRVAAPNQTTDVGDLGLANENSGPPPPPL